MDDPKKDIKMSSCLFYTGSFQRDLSLGEEQLKKSLKSHRKETSTSAGLLCTRCQSS